jgi:two-component system sensor histidine kinase CpxA
MTPKAFAPLRPSRLLLKIFLWFWGAMTIAGIALLAMETVRAERLTNRWRGVTSDAFAFYATTIAKDHEDHNTGGARGFLTDLRRRTGIRAWLFDAQDQEVSGYARAEFLRESRWLRQQMKQLRAKSRQSGATEFMPLGEITLVAHTAGSPGGARYTLIGELPAARYGPWQAKPNIQALRLLAVLAAAGIVSWIVSRQLTAPIEALRAATRQLSGGDLSARAGAGLDGHRDELAQLARDFDLMAARIETLMREQEHLVGAQRRLVRDVSHELRSPLARAGVALELARDAAGASGDKIPGEAPIPSLGESLSRIEREIGRLGEMLDRLLVLARLDSGVQVPEAVEIDLAALTQSVISDANFEARNARRMITVDECAPCVITGTRDLLRSAIENVVRNAVRYTPENSTVEVSLRRRQDWAVLGVRDHGPGVPEAELSEIFRPFYRASSSRDRQSGGTGLGLAITERAVTLHGGRLQASNIEGGGLIVEIHLPLVSETSPGG